MPFQIPAAPEDHPPEDRLFVTALARGLTVLAAFKAGDRALSNGELAQRCQLAKSTVSRLSYTLCQLGYLQQDDAGKYRPAPKVLELGYAALSGVELRERAREPMRRLSTQTGLSLTLGLLQGTRVIYIETCRAPTRVSLHLDVGSSVPLATTAIGRALFAGMSEPERSQLLPLLAMEYGADWSNLEAKMRQNIQQYHELGYCSSFGEFEADIHAVAVPILGSHPALALNCSGPAYRLSPQSWSSEIAPALCALAQDLSG